MKKSFLKLALAVLTVGLFGSCSKINERLDNLEKEVSGIENEQIASINTQITNINSSIADLGQIRSDISSLKQSAENHGQEIFALQEADETLGNRIVNLETYLDEVLPTFAETEWVEATFSTLEQYEETCDAIAEIDAKIGTTSEKLSKDIKACADSLTKWVNKTFEGYYTAAQMDAKLGQMKSDIDSARAAGKITDAKADSLAGELAKVKPEVDTAKANIRAEYKAAVKSAIETSEGKLTKALQEKISEVNGKIESLTTRVGKLETSVADLKGRVDKLEAAIGAYTELQGTITEIIKKLLADVGDKPQNEQDTTIWKCITALQAQCGTFSTAIQTLQGLVGNKDVATQISEAIASLITTQKLEGLADAVSALKDIVYGKGDVKSLTQQIADINTALSTTYATKTQLSQDIAAAKSELQSQIDSLCNVIGADGDATTATGIFKKIAELNARVAALEAVKITIESTEYTNWSDAVQAVLNKVTALGIGNISGLQSALNDLEARLDKIEAMIQSVTILPAYTDGSVEAVNGILTIDFVVSPAAAVNGVTKDSIKVLVHEAKVQTKAASYTTIPVASADVNEATGDVTITADISGIAPAEGNGLTVAVNIRNGGISNFTTEAVPVTLALPAGALKGVFTVGIGADGKAGTADDVKVRFSQGNLWADDDKALHFEANQYAFSSSYNSDHVSHFTWSSTVGAAVITGSASGNYLFCDESHKVSVDGGEAIYYALSKDEWEYLIDTRAMTNGKARYSNAVSSSGITIGGTPYNGVFLYPDNYNGDVVSSSMTWDDINAAGIVFLPAAGLCETGDVKSYGSEGFYWSSSADSSGSYYMYFYSAAVKPDRGDSESLDYSARTQNYSVRLVTEVK